MLKKKEISKLLKPILWDYSIDPCDLYDVAIGVMDNAGGFTREKALIRILENLSWYELIDIFGLEKLKELLRKDLIEKFGNEMLRDKYEFARQSLHGEALSLSGWDPEYREKISNSLLSHRWHGAE